MSLEVPSNCDSIYEYILKWKLCRWITLIQVYVLLPCNDLWRTAFGSIHAANFQSGFKLELHCQTARKGLSGQATLVLQSHMDLASIMRFYDNAVRDGHWVAKYLVLQHILYLYPFAFSGMQKTSKFCLSGYVICSCRSHALLHTITGWILYLVWWIFPIKYTAVDKIEGDR